MMTEQTHARPIGAPADRAASRQKEADAARAALTGTAAERTRIVFESLRALARDSNDLTPVFTLGMAANRRSFPQFLTRFLLSDEGVALWRTRASIDTRSVDIPSLRALPDGTLGREYVRYLDDNKLDPDLFEMPDGLPEVAAYLSQRLRQVHDVWHVLTGYKPNVAGEVALQAFTYAQTRMPSALLIALLGIARWGSKNKGLARESWRAFRHGAQAEFLSTVRWEDHWATPVTELRARYRIVAAQAS